MLQRPGEVGEKTPNEKALKVNFVTFQVCPGAPPARSLFEEWQIYQAVQADNLTSVS